jgi:hypothetical protein
LADETGIDVSYLPSADGKDDGWTVLQTRIPVAIGFVPTLTCFPRSWKRSPPSWAAQAEEIELRDVAHESIEFERTYHSRADVSQQENWLRQLLSPSFVQWLGSAPEGTVGFEFYEGTLRCFRLGRLDAETEAQARADAERVGARVRDEALESEGLGVVELGSGVPERIEEAVAKVGFDAPPPDTATASLPFKRFARRDPRVYIAALGGVVGAFTVIFVGLIQVADSDTIDLLVSVARLIGGKGSAIGLGMIALVGWVAAIPGCITIASRRYGRVAFVRQYATARHLSLESPQSFHRRLMRTDTPAPAQFVLRGGLADRRDGRLVLCRSQKGVLKSYYDCVVLETRLADKAKTPAPIRHSVAAGHLLIERGGQADRDAASLDSFVLGAIQFAEQLEHDAAGD